MKTIIFITIILLMFPVVVINQSQNIDISLGKIYFPRPFIHAKKNYAKGIYWMVLTEKEKVPYFKIFNKEHELLFEEMAVIAPYKGRSKNFKYRVKKEFLRGYEYFRIKVTRPDNLIMAYFLVEKEETPKEEKKEN